MTIGKGNFEEEKMSPHSNTQQEQKYFEFWDDEQQIL